ncbi:hypothetical protein GQX74_008970 [Glossina fuscipes]|nr:hypothetical protein GQX74_008970 [Glossina fuscipes]
MQQTPRSSALKCTKETILKKNCYLILASEMQPTPGRTARRSTRRSRRSRRNSKPKVNTKISNVQNENSLGKIAGDIQEEKYGHEENEKIRDNGSENTDP